ncbi:uncharacterized protein CcaverHIS019_0209960 [Cutaneotrichosporon cavernicola]|uniref:Zn(2)-C6 fungal-type domain-containing protein n=1 Tax=Cutaneotrichosporon cavernicola TaxID=279322 RepID=A0AA48I1T3_9TREE|nr:uncharacterized protein CcaverHIS019_0209960 [Cutaneotrichosporon cavernicola]BEI89634.1 hypothetical protein CcaverHIS019_0209960 [Cutaneotrichosporon cavernicola]BEI97405.1 hypothetical protein CcaverHIS631_0209940 [Cutaneotrichosporon cavernicola]BEJ05183.1 hypothetical protein CcaverHIS641_0210000 [Cutaneotrichosporon cavernicola]
MDPFLALFAGDPTTNSTTTTTTIADLTPPTATGSPPEPGGQRSRSGCFTCRRRKVKCDELRPICEKCQIGQRECTWPPDDPVQRRKNRPRKPRTHTVSEPPKRRFKLPFHAPETFVSSLPTTVSSLKGKERQVELIPDILRAEMMMDPSFLQPYFPSVDERLVIRHYLSRTVHIILAFEAPHNPWNPWLTVHAPLAFTHLPGVSPAADALRTAMLAVGAVHLRYVSNPDDQEGAWRITRTTRPRVLELVRCALENPDGTPKSIDKTEVELVLAALLSCIIASSLAADEAWHSLITQVLSLISRMGGAQALLVDSPRDHLSPSRFVFEQLAIRDVFGCMTTELAPSILRDAFTPWFFEAESWSMNENEWESIERMFGMSRGMVDLISRACTLVSRVREKGYVLAEHHNAEPHVSSLLLRLPPRATARLPQNGSMAEIQSGGTLTTATTPGGTVTLTNAPTTMLTDKQELEEQANGLLAELKVWDNACNFTPFHPRTQYGNIAYRHATKIRLHRVVFGVSSSDPRIVSASRAIIELAKEMLAMYGRIVWLTWPLVIAGFHIPKGDPMRQSAVELLSEFGPHACFDNRAASHMMETFWRYHDNDPEDLTPWEVAQRMNSRPFLD